MTCMDPDLLDWCLADLDEQLGRQLDAIHHPAFQALESTWRGLQFLVDRTDFRQNVKIEVLDVSKEALHRDFEDTPDIIQSGLFRLTYVGEYDMPGGQAIAAIISAFEFDHRAQDVALLRNISKVAAAAHMSFIGAVSPAFFDKSTMEAVAGIRDLPIWFERAEYLKSKSFRETEDARDASANSRINARLPYIFLLSRIAHYLKLIQRENIGTTRDRRLLELNNWIKSLVTEMTDPGNDLQAAHPLREAKVTVEDIEDNPGFFRIKLFIVPHFQIEGVDISLSLVSQMPKAKR
ncbi:type VI secretion system contractile sheath domain-containing protein [Burkholderia ubonensis]|uniref:TssC1 N-terminal domain-containing protein n=1 Tax=Burkholderia ubonensis TaxID=101571 RepID=A0ABD4DX97_9BURK|nr:type VI secretion system contractile sheath large subunit [Burkholderia ubonensis]KVN80622.1 hypothetical protein WJ68_20810 [Burkholderia ubonensis]